ncbi:hypothetical protein K469DRAFT_722891 [Zopfia rhizophila CBS 207.26]|uniref:NACHT domain-containing protein n=1 Tax=Zopfia rhizophila CBS 207.26 TaxID=1314779 RepID=A0A6A6F0G6_9PEZI|nr:hypothetical protein K469DRAFT_722891 [Zopfia rhizophila CBS 207.26]
MAVELRTNKVSELQTFSFVRCHNREASEKCEAILDWLTPIDYAPQQSDFINRRQAGTGQWLLESTDFQEWMKTGKTLFCLGIPGAGKTILISVNNKSIGVAYLYCNFRRQSNVRSLYDSYKDKRTRPLLNEISRTLQSVAAMYSRVFIVVDALDECQVTTGCRMRFLLEIFNVQAKCQASLFATSRFIPEINEKFKESIYLDGHMSQLPRCVLRSSELQDEINAEIIKAVDGMLLLAQLLLDLLKGKKSLKAIHEEELAKQVLSWITCVKRPLTTSELEHALAVETEESQLDEEDLCRVEDMVSICAGLVTEYFKQTQKKRFPNIGTDIATICVTYLSFDESESGFCQNDEELKERLRSDRLYDYASPQIEASSQVLLAVKLFSLHSGYS